jgi:Zn-dependent protease
MLLAMVDLSSPLVWALIIGWILTVTLHELAHGIVAYLGGDYTIRERGGLTLNPLQYIDPIFSIVVPAVILVIGGIPLPGGVTYVDRSLLKSKVWDALVSVAGPVMNFIIYLLLLIPLHPAIGWVSSDSDPSMWTSAQVFVGALAALQLIAVVLNLLPIPPLDGFGILRPWLPEHIVEKAYSPSTMMFCILVIFLVVGNVRAFWIGILKLHVWVTSLMGFDIDSSANVWRAFAEIFRQ